MKFMYFWSVCFRDKRGFLNCDDICMCVVNKQFELLEIDYVDLLYDKIPLIITAGSVYLCGVCRHVVLLGLPVRLTWYPM